MNSCENLTIVTTTKMSIHDFKTSYTNIPQDKLKDNINGFISSILTFPTDILKDNINAFISSIFKLKKEKVHYNWSY